LEEKDEFEI
jgi:hypothetical protein